MSWPNHGFPYSAGAFRNSHTFLGSMSESTGEFGVSSISFIPLMRRASYPG